MDRNWAPSPNPLLALPLGHGAEEAWSAVVARSSRDSVVIVGAVDGSRTANGRCRAAAGWRRDFALFREPGLCFETAGWAAIDRFETELGRSRGTHRSNCRM